MWESYNFSRAWPTTPRYHHSRVGYQPGALCIGLNVFLATCTGKESTKPCSTRTNRGIDVALLPLPGALGVINASHNLRHSNTPPQMRGRGWSKRHFAAWRIRGSVFVLRIHRRNCLKVSYGVGQPPVFVVGGSMMVGFRQTNRTQCHIARIATIIKSHFL